MQGIEAPKQVVRAINYFNQNSSDYDVLIVIRGGGSAEDLQAFNHEDVVRAIYGSKIITLVAIGHEDDVSLAELAADLRAATPTDAARRLVPDKRQVITSLAHQQQALYQSLSGIITKAEAKIERVNHGFSQLYHALSSKLQQLISQNYHNIDQLIRLQTQKVSSISRLLVSLDPKAILARGYSIATVNGRVVTKPEQIKSESHVMLQLHQGTVELRRTKGGRNVRASSKSQDTSQTRLQF